MLFFAQNILKHYIWGPVNEELFESYLQALQQLKQKHIVQVEWT